MVFQERGEEGGEGEGRPANGQLCGVAKEGGEEGENPLLKS